MLLSLNKKILFNLFTVAYRVLKKEMLGTIIEVGVTE